MSSELAPSWAMTAEAIDGVNDTHLPPGIHVRVLPSATLGVPASVLQVYRVLINSDQVKRLGRSGGVLWMDSGGAVLNEPFTVTPGNPVFGYFPVPDVIFTELVATPSILPPPQPPPIPKPPLILKPPIPKLPIPRPPLNPKLPIPKPPLTSFPPRLRHPPAQPMTSGLTELAARLRPPAAAPARIEEAAGGRPAPFRFEALANSVMGPSPFQSRSKAPYMLAAWTIPLVRVVGAGTVQTIRWLDAALLREITEKDLQWRIWSLPVKEVTPRYHPTPHAQTEAEDRIQRAAVRRQPLYAAYTTAGPATAPGAGGADALKRVSQVQGTVEHWLDRLLNDMSKPTWELTDDNVIAGKPRSSTSVPIEPFLIAGAVDPDMGHFMGFGDIDEELKAENGTLVVYRIRGLWRWAPDQWWSEERPSFKAAVRRNLNEAIKSFPELKRLKLEPSEKGPFLDLHTLAVALVGLPPDAPGAAPFDGWQDRGWLSTPPPPNVRRSLRLLASGFLPHSIAALAVNDASGLRTLNPFPGAGRQQFGSPPPNKTPQSIVVVRPSDADGPTQGRFEDRDAPAGTMRYKLSQGDWFGRWGPWAFLNVPAKPRTPPMRPTIELYPQPPIVPTPVPNGPLSCMVQVRIPIPRTPELPAGGSALSRLDLVETFDGSPATITSYTLTALVGASIETHPPVDSEPRHDLLVINRNGPSLERCESRKISYTARWIDALSLVSSDADPAARTIVDPRPPEPPGVVTELRYTSRPDVQGFARVDLDFNTVAGTRYRVFASNETTLLKALDDLGQTAAASDIRSADPGAPRAERFRAHKALFTWNHFENLTSQPKIAEGPVTHFVHRISGSLDVLAFYRVLGEGPSGVLSAMSEAELVPFAVPNFGGPARPQVAIVNAGLDPTTDGVRLRVKTPRGKASPAAWRLRRASVPVDNPLKMNIVDQGVVTDTTVDGEGTTFDITSSQPLLAWRQYRFAVEVQAGPPPGAPTVGHVPPGEWSEASASVPLPVIPPDQPAAPSAVTIANSATNLQITFTHPDADSLGGTSVGPFRFEVWRVEPERRPSRRDLLFTRGTGNTWVATDTGPAKLHTYMTIRIIDPIGRRSDAKISNEV